MEGTGLPLGLGLLCSGEEEEEKGGFLRAVWAQVGCCDCAPLGGLLLGGTLGGAGAMQELVAGMERLRVELEADVEQQGGAQPLPFPGTCSEMGARALG